MCAAIDRHVWSPDRQPCPKQHESTDQYQQSKADTPPKKDNVIVPLAGGFSVNRNPNPMNAGQAYSLTWTRNDSNIDYVSYQCTPASAGGYSASGSLNWNQSVNGIAQAAWAGISSQCAWAGYDINGEEVFSFTEFANTINAPTNGAGYFNQSIPGSVTAGQSFTISINMYNSGNTTWSPGGSYSLGSQNPQDNNTWGLSRISVGGSIAPGASKNFTATVTAPSTPGNYNMQWRMVQDGVEWFGGLSDNAVIQVNPIPTPPALTLSSCTSNNNTTSPTPASSTCTLSNTGQTATSSISYTAPAGTTASGPTGSCAANSTCGNVTVTTNTAAGNYTGSLTATPNTGTGASTSINLTVNAAATPPALSFSCSGGASTTSPTPAVTTCTLSNTGQTAASSISYSSIAGVSITGQVSSCAANSTCGNITLTTSTAAGNYAGTYTATPNTGTAASTSINLTVNAAATPPALSFSCTGGTSTVSPTPASRTCILSNTGQTAASSISYSSIAGVSITGQVSSCAANSTCANITLTTATAAGNYTGTYTATPNTGTAASTSINLTVNAAATPPTLSFSCSGGASTTSPTPAVTTCILSNTGQTAASSISYSSIAGISITGQVSSCAANSTCGNITLTTATAAGNYTGTYTATPNTGTAATRAINMTVAAAGAAVLNLSNCTSTNNTTSPAPASSTCTLSNTGSTAVSSISYTAPAGTTASGPTGSCAANSTCGNVTVTTSTAAGNYTGNLTATPNAGTAAVTGINLTVNTGAGAPTLSLLSCTSNNFTTTPNKASTTCSLKNTGTVAISSISYSTLAGMSTTGPTGACAANTVCGTVVVNTGTTAGNYTGTLSISSVPAASSATNLAIDLTVNGINAETVTYLHTDGLGSPVAKSNASGVRIKQTKYEPYGMTVAGTDKPTIGFTGHYNDSDTELTYMQQRYYDPVAARFLSEDPVLTDQNTGTSFNRYVYANNNPYRYIDPDGRETNPVSGKSGISNDELRTNKSNPNVGKFGNSRSSSNWNKGYHNGVDIAAAKGTPLVAPISGKVTTLDASTNDKGGNVVYISAKVNGEVVTIGMAHLDTKSVKTGDVVKEGDPIGTSGVTGNAKGNPIAEAHVHMSVKINGVETDPQKHFEKNPSKVEK